MQLSKVKQALVALLFGVAACAQTPQIESEDVARVGAHIACQCGSCKETVTCPMSKRGCGFCTPAKVRIYQMQKAGLSDSAIIDTYKKEFGDKIFVADPSPFYWIVPALAIVLGIVAIYWFVKRYTTRAAVAVPPAPDPNLARFSEQIERETANLE